MCGVLLIIETITPPGGGSKGVDDVKRRLFRLAAIVFIGLTVFSAVLFPMPARAGERGKLYRVRFNKSMTRRVRTGIRLKLVVKAGRVKRFVSSAPGVASVGRTSGLVRVKRHGRARITAVLASGKRLVLRLVCIDPNRPDAISIRQGSAGGLAVGETLRLTVKAHYQYPDYVTRKPGITWKSSNPAVAAVSKKGLVTAVSRGKARVTAESFNGKKASFRVSVGERLKGIRIGIDPGHQAKANLEQEAIAPGSSKTKYKVTKGTRGYVTGVWEYRLVLDVGFKLRDALEKQGATVYMTRTSNKVDISNQQRAKMMNEAQVDLVLRLHCDGEHTHTRQGIGLYVTKTGSIAQSSYRAAEVLMEEMLAATGAKRYGIFKRNSYTGLNWSQVPAILVEMGFMSHAREDVRLNKPAYQDKLVNGMVEGICAWLGR